MIKKRSNEQTRAPARQTSRGPQSLTVVVVAAGGFPSFALPVRCAVVAGVAVAAAALGVPAGMLPKRHYDHGGAALGSLPTDPFTGRLRGAKARNHS